MGKTVTISSLSVQAAFRGTPIRDKQAFPIVASTRTAVYAAINKDQDEVVFTILESTFAPVDARQCCSIAPCDVCQWTGK